jgi:hypothetical protein
MLASEVSGSSRCALRSELRAAGTTPVLTCGPTPCERVLSCTTVPKCSPTGACTCLGWYSAVHLVVDATKTEGVTDFLQHNESW